MQQGRRAAEWDAAIEEVREDPRQEFARPKGHAEIARLDEARMSHLEVRLEMLRSRLRSLGPRGQA